MGNEQDNGLLGLAIIFVFAVLIIFVYLIFKVLFIAGIFGILISIIIFLLGLYEADDKIMFISAIIFIICIVFVFVGYSGTNFFENTQEGKNILASSSKIIDTTGEVVDKLSELEETKKQANNLMNSAVLDSLNQTKNELTN